MWELDHKEGRAWRNWCFQTVVLEKTLESPLDCQEITSVNSDAGKDWGHEENGWQRMRWFRLHHWLNGYKFEQTPGESEEQGSPVYCSSWDSQRVGHDSKWTIRVSLICSFTGLLRTYCKPSTMTIEALNIQNPRHWSSCLEKWYKGNRLISFRLQTLSEILCYTLVKFKEHSGECTEFPTWWWLQMSRHVDCLSGYCNCCT